MVEGNESLKQDETSNDSAAPKDHDEAPAKMSSK